MKFLNQTVAKVKSNPIAFLAGGALTFYALRKMKVEALTKNKYVYGLSVVVGAVATTYIVSAVNKK